MKEISIHVSTLIKENSMLSSQKETGHLKSGPFFFFFFKKDHYQLLLKQLLLGETNPVTYFMALLR